MGMEGDSAEPPCLAPSTRVCCEHTRVVVAGSNPLATPTAIPTAILLTHAAQTAVELGFASSVAEAEEALGRVRAMSEREWVGDNTLLLAFYDSHQGPCRVALGTRISVQASMLPFAPVICGPVWAAPHVYGVGSRRSWPLVGRRRS